MRIEHKAIVMIALGLVACSGSTAQPVQGSPGATLTAALMARVHFEDGQLQKETLPRADPAAERVKLSRDSSTLSFAPAEASIMGLDVDNPDQQTNAVEATLVQFADGDGYIKVPAKNKIKAADTGTAPSDRLTIENPYTVDADLCDELCNKIYETQCEFAVLLHSGGVSLHQTRNLLVDCTKTGHADKCSPSDKKSAPGTAQARGAAGTDGTGGVHGSAGASGDMVSVSTAGAGGATIAASGGRGGMNGGAGGNVSGGDGGNGTGGSGEGGAGSGGRAGASSQAGQGGAAGSQAGQGGASGPMECVPPGNRALHFGGGQYVQVQDSASLEPTDLTLETWVNFALLPSTAATDGATIVAKPYGSVYVDSFIIVYSQGALYAGVGLDGTSNGLHNAWTPDTGRWYHIAFSYDHTTGKQMLYVDGSLLVSGDAPGAPVYDSHPLYLGVDLANDAPITGFVGDIDEVSLWSTARSTSEIAADAASPPSSAAAGLAAHWSLDDGTGQAIADASPSHNPGYLGSIQSEDAADPTWIASSVPFGSTYTIPAAGLCGQCVKSGNMAMHFSGAQYLQVTDPTALRPASVTISLRANLSAPISACSIAFGKPYGSATYDSYAMGWGSAGAPVISEDATNSISSADPVTVGHWHYMAQTYDATTNTQKFYIDENLVASGQPSSALSYDAHAFYVGSDGNNGVLSGSPVCGFRGDIDELRFWNRALSIDEISADMHACTPDPAGLIGAWSFDEGAGQVAQDTTTNADTLQLGSAVTADSADPTWIPSTVPF
jgi:hypothetical protein